MAESVPLGGSNEPKESEAENGWDEGEDVEQGRSGKVRTRSKVVPQGEVENLEIREKENESARSSNNGVERLKVAENVRRVVVRARGEKEEEGREFDSSRASFLVSKLL